MVVVITGTTKGIGKAIAQQLAAEGHDLALCARTEEDLIGLGADLAAYSDEARIMTRAVDMQNRSSISDFARHTLETFGQVDVLINNAGVFRPGKIVDESDEVFTMVMETNLYGAYFLTKDLVPTMIDRKSGHIINLCSVASIKAYPNGGSYAISKHALHGFGKTLREEVREFGIRVTNIMPGATWTDSWSGADLPEERLMDPGSIAEMVSVAIRLDAKAVLEELIIRPVLGDL